MILQLFCDKITEMFQKNLLIWIYSVFLSHENAIFAGTVERVYIKDNALAIKGGDLEIVCDVSNFQSSNIIGIFKFGTVPNSLSGQAVQSQCIPSMCIGNVERHTFIPSSTSVTIAVTVLNRQEDEKWWICAIDNQRRQLFITVYTPPESLVLQGSISGEDLEAQDATLSCVTSNCIYPSPPKFQWFYSEGSSEWLLYKNVTPSGSQTSCVDSEKKYTATLQLPRYTTWPLQPSNVETSVKFQCRLDLPTLQSPLQSAESGNVVFAVQVTSATLRYDSSKPSDILHVISGVSITLTCSTSVSRPTATVVWYIGTEEKQRSNSSFTFTPQNSDNNKQIFCKAFNIQPENQAVYSNRTTLFVPDSSLNLSFYIEGHSGETTVSVDEHDADLQFKCIVESKLASSVKLMFEDNVIEEQINKSFLSVVRQDVACFDTGVYICEGSNNYKRASKAITLFVRCSPRPLRQIQRNMTSALWVPFTFSFTVIGYPEPGPKGFSWSKLEEEGWQTLLSNNDLHIYSSRLQSNLTLLNVSNEDFGHYRVMVANDIGIYTQHLYLLKENSRQLVAKENIISKSDNTALIVGVTLGLLCGALTIYATYLTIVRHRLLSKRKGTSSGANSAKQTTYANTTFVPGITEYSANDNGLEEAETAHEYTDLSRNVNTENNTYDVIKRI